MNRRAVPVDHGLLTGMGKTVIKCLFSQAGNTFFITSFVSTIAVIIGLRSKSISEFAIIGGYLNFRLVTVLI